MKGFALGLALKRRRKATRKSLISLNQEPVRILLGGFRLSLERQRKAKVSQPTIWQIPKTYIRKDVGISPAVESCPALKTINPFTTKGEFDSTKKTSKF